MTVTTPDWLAKRGGELQQAPDGHTWCVLLNGSQQYKLSPSPAAGKFTCMILQTVNGKRLDKGTTYPTAADAVRGGLEELRAALGW
jgi:hypothetical protein